MNKNIKILFGGGQQRDIDLWIGSIQLSGLQFSYFKASDKTGFREALTTLFPNVIVCGFSKSSFEPREIISIRNEISPLVPLVAIVGQGEESGVTEYLTQGTDEYVLDTDFIRLPFAVKTSVFKQNSLLFKIKAENEVRIDETRFGLMKRAIHNLTNAIVAVDNSGHILLWNKSAEAILGWNSKDVTGLLFESIAIQEFIGTDLNGAIKTAYTKGNWEGEVHLGDRAKIRSMVWCVISVLDKNGGDNSDLMFEYRLPRQSDSNSGGKDKLVSPCQSPKNRKANKNYILGDNGIPNKDGCIDLLINSLKIGFFSLDLAEERICYDDQSCYFLGLDPHNYNGTKAEFYELVHPDDRDEIKTIFRFTVEREKDFEVEFRTIMRDGSLRHIVAKAKIVYGDHQVPLSLTGLIWEITDQKLLEIYLRENLRKMNSIINNLNGAVFRCKVDDNMTIEYISGGIKKITGYNSWEFLLNRVRSLFSIMAAKDMEMVRNEVNAALASGNPYTVEFRVVASNGERKWLWMKGQGVYSGKSLVAHEGLISDISERKKVESRLNKSLKQLQQLNNYMQTVREKERLVIARELHDDLGQSLTAVKIDLGTLKNKIDNKDEALERIDKLGFLVSDAIKTVQNITAHLRPQIIDDLGLVSAIEWYSKDYSNRTGIKVFLKLMPVLDISAESSLTVFRILQESLTNIARHSKATKAEIRLWIHEKSLFMEVKDNGIGISEHDKKSKKSFGLMSMMERANSLGGEISVQNPEEGGTTVSLKLPFKEKTKYEDSYL